MTKQRSLQHWSTHAPNDERRNPDAQLRNMQLGLRRSTRIKGPNGRKSRWLEREQAVRWLVHNSYARSRYFSKQSLCQRSKSLPTFHGSGAHGRVSPFPLIGKHKVGSSSRTPVRQETESACGSSAGAAARGRQLHPIGSRHGSKHADLAAIAVRRKCKGAKIGRKDDAVSDGSRCIRFHCQP